MFGELFNAMIDPKQEAAKKMPVHMPNFVQAAANPDLAVKMVLRKEAKAKSAWWKAHARLRRIPLRFLATPCVRSSRISFRQPHCALRGQLS